MIIKKIKLLVGLILFLSINMSVFAQDANQIIVAKVNDTPITLEELNKEVEEHNYNLENDSEGWDKYFRILCKEREEYLPLYSKITNREQKILFLKKAIVGKELLYQEALRRGLDKKLAAELHEHKTDWQRQTFLVGELTKQLIGELKPEDVNDGEAEAFYNKHKKLFKELFEDREAKENNEIEGKERAKMIIACIKTLEQEESLVSKLFKEAKIEIYEDKIQ